MNDRPLLLVCEDGTDYVDRFTRLLGGELRFERATDLAAARAALARGPIGLLLDLDFRRAPRAGLVDDAGRASGAPGLAEVQGILILRALRADGVTLPALLFADLDDPARARALAETLAPLEVIGSGESLPAIAARLRRWALTARPPAGSA